MRSILPNLLLRQRGALAVGLAALLALAVGCVDEPAQRSSPGAADTTSRQAALAVLDSLRQGVFRSAFAHLEHYAFTRRTETVQLNSNDEANVRRSRVLRYGYRDGRRAVQVKRADSTGSFDFGLLGRFADEDLERANIENMGRQLISEEPPYLSERNQEAFSYRLLGDTLVGTRSARIIAIQTRPEAAADQALKRARLYVDRATHQLVGVRLVRQSNSLLLDEASRLEAMLQPMDTTWVPFRTCVKTRLHIPIWGKRAFRTSSSFSSYTPDLER